MKRYSKATKSTRILIILFIVFLVADFFLYKNRESTDALIIFIVWWIFTLFLLYWIIHNLIKNLEFKKTIKLKEKWLFQPINTKIIRFDFEAISGSWKGYYHIVSSNWQTEFSSESIKGKFIWFDIMKLTPLYSIWFKCNFLEIEKTINKLDELQTPDDIKSYIENNNPILNILGKGIQQLSKWMYYNEMLSQVNECKEYLKVISKTHEFKNAYLEHKNYQIHIWDNITVYIDPNDPTVYQVDTGFLYM